MLGESKRTSRQHLTKQSRHPNPYRPPTSDYGKIATRDPLADGASRAVGNLGGLLYSQQAIGHRGADGLRDSRTQLRNHRRDGGLNILGKV